MTYALNEPFDDVAGRWDQYAPWDATMASDGVKGFLTTQKHVDLRCFRVLGNIDPAPQNPNLDTVQQSVLDAETQTQMETQLAANDASENWTLNAYFQTVSNYGPKLYWRFGESSGTTAADSSNNHNTGTYGSGCTLAEPGALGGDPTTSVLFNNTANARVTCGYAPFVMGTSRTFMGLANRIDTTGNDTLIGASGTYPGTCLLRISSGNENVEFFAGTTQEQVWTAAWPGTGQWVHWALTYNDSTRVAELFLNGVSQGQKTFTSGNGFSGTAGSFQAGAWATGNDPFNGYMQGITVYETILTATQIQTAYKASIMTGLNAITVGTIASRGGWAGLTTTTTGSVVDARLTSSITKPIDISPGQSLSMIFPDYNAWDTDSFVQLTSDPNGIFGNGYDSAQVTFAANTAAMPHLKLPISSFAQAGFDNTKVTGIKIRLHKATAPAANQPVTLMAIRSLDSGWQIAWLDFDTRIGAICRPVTLDGLPTTGTVAESFQFIRGAGDKNDPIPADIAMNMYFYPGGSTSPNDATGATYNYLAFLFREQKNISVGTGSHIEAGLQFNDSQTFFVAKKVSTTGGSPGTETDTGSYSVSVGGPLDPSKHYLFRVQIKGTQIIPTIWQVNTNHTIVALVWQSVISISNTAYAYGNGRVGFIGNLVSRDAYIEAIEAAPTGYAELETVTYSSRTPVDGAQLSAVYAEDMNLFTSMSGTTLVNDSTKTISGDGSFRATGSLNTNTFLVDDWTQMYLELAIWVGNTVSSANQPQIMLNVPGSSAEILPMSALKPAQWNMLYFDLGVFRNLISATNYSFTIQPGGNPDKPLGFYWIDSVNIGRRRVAWSVRATSTGLWREFKEMANNPNGAIHFTPEERGTQLQLKADALTEDAWVGSFHLFPRYAQLGLPLFDQGGTYENFAADQ